MVKLRNLDSEGPLSIALLMFLAIYFSMNLGLRSDKDCRRKMLILSLIGSVGAIVVLTIAANVTQHTLTSVLLYLSALAIDGILGSAATPIGRAAYFDIWDVNSRGYGNKDRLVTDTNIIQALPWVLLCFNRNLFENLLIPVAFFFLAMSLFLVIVKFRDLRDKDARIVSNELKQATKKYLHGYALRLMIAFLFFDLAFQFINYLAETLYDLNGLRQEFLFVEGAGIFLGGIIARIGFTYTKHFRSSHKTILISSIALFFVFFIPWIKVIFDQTFVIDNLTRLLFSSIGGVVLALSFGYFSHKVTAHETGLLFGIMEGIEIFAEGMISLTFFLGNIKGPAGNPHIASIVMLVLIGIGVLFVFRKEEEKTPLAS